jgi:hypothetical protein
LFSIYFDRCELQLFKPDECCYRTIQSSLLPADPKAMLAHCVDPRCPNHVSLAAELAAWVDGAQAGDRVAYHEGQLGADRLRGSSLLTEKDRRRLETLARRAWALAAASRIHLIQQRVEVGRSRYLAVKARHRTYACEISLQGITSGPGLDKLTRALSEVAP